MRLLNRLTRLLALGAVACTIQACSTVHFYEQAMLGQLEIWRRTRPVEEVIADPQTTPFIRERLRLLTTARDFAQAELALPDHGSYHSYADLERSYVVWNVFAAPELSLQPVSSCFPIAGCLDYRGFFSPEAARQRAEKLKAEGYDVFSGGVVAYSTLGWLNDPILNTYLHWEKARLVETLFHELAHQRLYIEDDSRFNESFATAVARAGLRRWTEKHAESEQLDVADKARENTLIALILETREDLAELYASSLPEAEKLADKQRYFAEMQTRYAAVKAAWQDDKSFDSWMSGEWNNARIMAVATYNDFVPAFERLLRESDKDFELFFRVVTALGALPPAERTACLNALLEDENPAPCVASLAPRKPQALTQVDE